MLTNVMCPSLHLLTMGHRAAQYNFHLLGVATRTGWKLIPRAVCLPWSCHLLTLVLMVMAKDYSKLKLRSTVTQLQYEAGMQELQAEKQS